jgi:hypothetical protein
MLWRVLVSVGDALASVKLTLGGLTYNEARR